MNNERTRTGSWILTSNTHTRTYEHTYPPTPACTAHERSDTLDVIMLLMAVSIKWNDRILIIITIILILITILIPLIITITLMRIIILLLIIIMLIILVLRLVLIIILIIIITTTLK